MLQKYESSMKNSGNLDAKELLELPLSKPLTPSVKPAGKKP